MCDLTHSYVRTVPSFQRNERGENMCSTTHSFVWCACVCARLVHLFDAHVCVHDSLTFTYSHFRDDGSEHPPTDHSKTYATYQTGGGGGGRGGGGGGWGWGCAHALQIPKIRTREQECVAVCCCMVQRDAVWCSLTEACAKYTRV